MGDQFLLFGDEPSPPAPRRPSASPVPAATVRRQPGHSLFLALVPTSEDAAGIVESGRRIERDCGVRGRALEAERLHVSLYPVGAYDDVLPQELVDAVRAAADKVTHPAFDVVFDRAATFGGAAQSRPFVLKSGDDGLLVPLHAFRVALGVALADAGLPITDRKMTPHMTLSYAPQVAAEIAMAPLRWRAREFVLIDSHVGQHEYRMLGRWALTD
jgi:2'-5' RNA ligase